ncbi:hypothetical protein CASFOL_016817 [Castilleja foliolosa]|uniref:Ubiquitin-like protease family profile domain-containing protein n=1 Tax=Castilleja foliolosa TaxID=1961234 RepID=A0ABD3D9A7_9LAMI
MFQIPNLENALINLTVINQRPVRDGRRTIGDVRCFHEVQMVGLDSGLTVLNAVELHPATELGPDGTAYIDIQFSMRAVWVRQLDQGRMVAMIRFLDGPLNDCSAETKCLRDRYYRWWIVEKIGSEAITNELKLARKKLWTKGTKNYLAWSHIQCNMNKFKPHYWLDELQFRHQILEKDKYNVWAWDQGDVQEVKNMLEVTERTLLARGINGGLPDELTNCSKLVKLDIEIHRRYRKAFWIGQNYPSGYAVSALVIIQRRWRYNFRGGRIPADIEFFSRISRMSPRRQREIYDLGSLFLILLIIFLEKKYPREIIPDGLKGKAEKLNLRDEQVNILLNIVLGKTTVVTEKWGPLVPFTEVQKIYTVWLASGHFYHLIIDLVRSILKASGFYRVRKDLKPVFREWDLRFADKDYCFRQEDILSCGPFALKMMDVLVIL